MIERSAKDCVCVSPSPSQQVTLQKTSDRMGIPRIKVQVHNNKSSETIAMDEFEFVKGTSNRRLAIAH